MPVVALSVPTVRPQMFLKYLDTLRFVPAEFRVYAYFQEYSAEDLKLVQAHPAWSRITPRISPIRLPPYIARMELYTTHLDVDVWISTDDDFEFMEITNYLPAIQKVCEPAVGCVGCNWVAHETFLKKRKLKDEFVKQHLVYTGGGMVFSRKIVDLLKEWPIKEYEFDDMQIPLTAYVHGYTNYRYLGSLLIHRIMNKDGLHRMYKERSLVPPDPRYIKIRECAPKYRNGNDLAIPMSSDITDYAHLKHNENKEKAILTARSKYFF
jgi:hypothetical protein